MLTQVVGSYLKKESTTTSTYGALVGSLSWNNSAFVKDIHSPENSLPLVNITTGHPEM